MMQKVVEGTCACYTSDVNLSPTSEETVGVLASILNCID